MELGIEFRGATIAESYSYDIIMATEQSYGLDSEVQMTCTGTDAVGLWQWVTESNDGRSQVQSMYSVCRQGADAYTSPECPWNACMSGDCTKCSDDWSA